uniref:GAG-pre-integrase domain-containing protein n=1 Tax=Solanum lycopersicum TaxID=4081 RepID=A0A3Q7H7Q0_SOLLC
MSVGEAYVKIISQTDNFAIWHARSGHVGYQMLQHISSKKLLDGLPTLKNVCEDVICQRCQYGKFHLLPFKRSSNQRTTMFELIHTDLMGPIITPRYSRYRYVMVLVDDYTRFTVFLSWLHDKSLPRELWVEAIQCGFHVINRVDPWPGTKKSPFKILYCQKTNVNYFPVFGYVFYVHIPRTNRTKT